MYNWFVIRDSFVETPSIQGFKRELTNSKNFRYDDWLNTNLLILCSRLFAPWLWWKSFQQHTFILCISMYIDRMIPEFLRSALPDLGTARRGRSTVTGSRVNPACYRATQIFLRGNPPSSFVAQRFFSKKSRIKIVRRYVVGWNLSDLDTDESSMREMSIWRG